MPADSWSASTLTLTNAGDWAKWSITLTSTDAAQMNSNFGGVFALRGAMSRASVTGGNRVPILIMVNDNLAAGNSITGGVNLPLCSSTSSWTSAGRFTYLAGNSLGRHVTGQFPTIGFEGSGPQLVTPSTPWVAGTNTIRLITLGRNTTGAAEPLEIDFLGIQSETDGTGLSFNWASIGGDQSPDAKPVTVPFGHVGFDAHADPDPINLSPPPAGHAVRRTWALKGSSASTGTVADSLLQVVKFCPQGAFFTATVRVTGAGSPVSGIVGASSGVATYAITTLDGNGEATFNGVLTTSEAATLWYGGTDIWAPAGLFVDRDTTINCSSGWYVGRIGMGS